MGKLILCCVAAALRIQAQTPTVTAVSNDGRSSPAVSAGSAGYVFGSNFGTVEDTTVTVGVLNARVLSVSSNQIRALFPRNLPAGLATLTVTVDGKVSQMVSVIVSRRSPGQVSLAEGKVAAAPAVAYSPPHMVEASSAPFSLSSPLTTGTTGGIVYTCDPTVTAVQANVCTTLNTTIAGLYSRAFTNANASIYVTLGMTNAVELSNNDYTVNNKTYSTFRTALIAAESDANDMLAVTDSVPAANPYPAYPEVILTNANARALGFAVTSGTLANLSGSCPLGTANCYDGVITISNAVPFYFRTGPAITSGQYDFFTIVEHGTDEILGTASCAFPGTCTGLAPADYFRYHSNGTRAHPLSGSAGTNDPCSSVSSSMNACFSLDGMHMLQQYNNLDTSLDAGDWTNGCANPLVQDTTPCAGIASVDISPAAEILVLDVVGYTLNTSTLVTNVTSTTPNGTYGVGASISIQVTFNGAVTVAGTPQLALNSGGAANYTSGSGTSTLTFLYVVAAGQTSPRLEYTSTSALTLNGGTIQGQGSAAAVLTLPTPGAAGSLSFNTFIVIGTSTSTTIQTNPEGLQFSVDGGAVQVAPQTFTLPQGSHTIAVVTTQSGGPGIQEVFANWNDGLPATHMIAVGVTPATFTATFTTQYQLTIGASPAAGGSVTPASGTYYASGTVVPIAATPNTGYSFVNWTGGAVASATSASTTVTMTAPETVTANFSQGTGITIQTSPSGLQFSVDGGAVQIAPQVLSLTQGTHTIAVATTQPGAAGTQYAFTGWSDSGAASHTIIVGTAAATYTASFTTQYQLTIGASPAAGGIVTPSSGTYYNAGTVVPISAAANTGFTFSNWTGTVASASSASTTVTMNSALTVTANFSSLTGISITMQTSPSGLQFSVDGGAVQIAPQTLSLPQGTHTIAVAAKQPGAAGTQYVFTGWSDGGAASHSITVGTAAATYTASFTTQYQLTIGASPAAGGSVTPPSGTYYNAGMVVPIAATANSGYTFVNWTGAVASSTSAATSVTMTAPLAVTANFSTTVTTTGLAFFPVTPCRVTDTRSGSGQFGAPSMAANTTRNFNITQSECGIPATAQAYSLNVTAVPPAPLTYLSIWPAGQTQPTVSTLNSFDGQVVANAAIVPAGTAGAISIYVSNLTDVLIDIDGYFAPPAAQGLAFYPLTPCRIADTRGTAGAFGGPQMTAQSTRNFPVTSSACNVPSTAQAYSLNMTVVPPAALIYLTTWPAGEVQPTVSTLNSFNGRIVANAAIVPAGTSGAIDVYVYNNSDVIIDINGYFAPPGNPGALYFYKATPCRIADTRTSVSGFAAGFGPPSLAANSARTFAIQSSACGLPATAQAYSFNMTVVPPAPLTYLTTWPTGVTQPVVSTLNALNGTVVANAAIVPAGTNGSINIFVSNATDFILDVNGYFAQ